MMVEDRGKDEFSAQNLMKKHEALEAAVEDYRDNVRQLGEVARQLASEGHPQSEVIFLSCSCHSSTNSRTWYIFWLKFSWPFNHLKTNHSLISDILNMRWFFFSCSRHCFTSFSKRDPNYLISDLWNFYSNYLWNFLILVHWCPTIPSGETLCWFEGIGQRKESQVGWRSQTFHVESWGKFPFPVLWKRIHAISSYKDHLYKVQVLNPPEFKDHQYRILKN